MLVQTEILHHQLLWLDGFPFDSDVPIEFVEPLNLDSHLVDWLQFRHLVQLYQCFRADRLIMLIFTWFSWLSWVFWLVFAGFTPDALHWVAADRSRTDRLRLLPIKS